MAVRSALVAACFARPSIGDFQRWRSDYVRAFLCGGDGKMQCAYAMYCRRHDRVFCWHRGGDPRLDRACISSRNSLQWRIIFIQRCLCHFWWSDADLVNVGHQLSGLGSCYLYECTGCDGNGDWCTSFVVGSSPLYIFGCYCIFDC